MPRIPAAAKRAAAILILVLLGVLSILGPLRAQNMSRAAAVVNDEVISMLDLVMRTRLAMISAGLQDSPENRERLQQQVLRALIDEKLQVQEATRLDISVSTGDIEAALERIAKQNNMSREQFLEVMEKRGLLPSVLIDQIRAGIAWRTLVSRRLQPTVEISDDEVDEAVARLAADRGNPENLLAEIFLSVDNVLQEQDVLATAERLIDQLRNGANFNALARQFSQSATASVGGDLGWVRDSQLPEEVASAVKQMSPGQLSNPIRTFGGVYIILLRERRQGQAGSATVRLTQILFTVPPGAPAEVVQEAADRANAVRGQIANCVDAGRAAQEFGSPGSGDLGEIQMSNLPGQLQQTVAGLAIGQPSAPVRLSGGIGILVVCGRADGDIDRDQVYDSLLSQRLGLMARRYMRDLRRQANVDIRL